MRGVELAKSTNSDAVATALINNPTYDHYKGKEWWRKCDRKAFQDLWILKGRSQAKGDWGFYDITTEDPRRRGARPDLRREGVRLASVPDLSLSTLLAQIFTGLVLGGILVLLATGLSLIFGLMAVVNFSHGSLYMLGAYFGFFLLAFTKSFWIALIGAPLLVGIFGLLMERFLVRPLYGRSPDDPLLLTFGLSLVLVEVVKVIWGRVGLTLDPAPSPRGLRRTSGSWCSPRTGSSSWR